MLALSPPLPLPLPKEGTLRESSTVARNGGGGGGGEGGGGAAGESDISVRICCGRCTDRKSECTMQVV